MDENKSRVYALLDEQNNITRIEGEYSLPQDLTNWTLIEEGTPCDRLNHAQNHYLAKPIRNDYGNYNYSYTNGVVVENDTTELDEIAQAKQNAENRIAELKQLLADTDYCVIKLMENEATTEQYAEVLANRKEWRAEINRLESEATNE